MNPWTCAFLIALSGAIGGVLNALLSDNGFLLPRLRRGVWCPGFVSNVLAGAFAAFASWAFYGSGAAIDLADLSTRNEISLRFSAIAGAFMVGFVGAKWITNEADKMLLKESVKVASKDKLPPDECERLVQGSAEQVLSRVEHA
jgi:hypothetical protein